MVTYIIHSGRACEIASPRKSRTVKDAVEYFCSYIEACKRIGNGYADAQLYILDTDAIYTVGPRGGIRKQ